MVLEELDDPFRVIATEDGSRIPKLADLDTYTRDDLVYLGRLLNGSFTTGERYERLFNNFQRMFEAQGLPFPFEDRTSEVARTALRLTIAITALLGAKFISVAIAVVEKDYTARGFNFRRGNLAGDDNVRDFLEQSQILQQYPEAVSRNVSAIAASCNEILDDIRGSDSEKDRWEDLDVMNAVKQACEHSMLPLALWSR